MERSARREPRLANLLVCVLVALVMIGLPVALLVGVTVVWAASVTPTHVERTAANLCPDGMVQLRTPGSLGAGDNQTVSDGRVTVSFDVYAVDGGDPASAIDWTLETAGYTIFLVVTMDGVLGGYLYDYRPDGATSDTFLTSPAPRYPDISHVDFCYAVPTAVELAAFEAAPQGNGVLLTWETASEVDNVGFNVYRAETQAGQLVKLNAYLIASQNPGSAVGAAYSFLDEPAAPGATYYYWLEDVDASGAATRHGPVAVKVGAVRTLPGRPRPAPM